MEIIIRGKDEQHKFGKTRSEHEENMKKEWGSSMSGEQLDKLKFLERKYKDKTGSTKNFFRGQDIDTVE